MGSNKSTGAAKQQSGSKGDSRPSKDASNPSVSSTAANMGARHVMGGAAMKPNPTNGGCKPQKSGSQGG